MTWSSACLAPLFLGPSSHRAPALFPFLIISLPCSYQSWDGFPRSFFPGRAPPDGCQTLKTTAPKLHSCVCPAPWTGMFGVEKFAKLPLGWPADLGRRRESGLPLLTWVSQGYSLYSCTGCTERCPGQRGNRSWDLTLTPHTCPPTWLHLGGGRSTFVKFARKHPMG